MKEYMYKEAKEIFFDYQGNAFFMTRDGVYETFKNYAVPQVISDQWYQELLLKNKEQLLSESNNSEIVWRFYLYLHLIQCNKDYFEKDDIEFAFDFFIKNQKLDDYSKLKIIETIIDFLKSQSSTFPLITNFCKNILINMNIDSFTIDESYKNNNYDLSNLSQENLSNRISYDIKELTINNIT